MRHLKNIIIIAAILVFSLAFPAGAAEAAQSVSGSVQNVQSQSEPAQESRSGITQEQSPQGDHKVTMMIYMIGSDLESKSGAASADLEEIRKSGVDLSRVNLLVYTGGTTKWRSGISTEQNTVFKLEKAGYKRVGTFDSVSMGESDTLTGFLDYALENYPADTYDLILWDHGNGPLIGYGKDTLYGGDGLTLPEMKTAFEESAFADAGIKLGFIGFDACLMSSAELACTLSDYADLLIASQEVEPYFGWNYDFLAECGHVDERSLSELVVEDYMEDCEAYFAEHENFNSDVTMACIDLSYADELETAVNKLFSKAKRDITGDFAVLAKERVAARTLGKATTGYDYDLVDLGSAAACMAQDYPSETAAVSDVLDKMVVRSETNTSDCCGLSLYYPYYNKKKYTKEWKQDYAAIGLFKDYRAYLERYEQIWLGTDMEEYFAEPLTPTEYKAGSYSLQLTDEQAEAYASGGYYILERVGDEIYRQVGYSSNVTLKKNRLTADFDGRTLVVTNDCGDSTRITGEFTESRDGKDYYTLSYTMSDAPVDMDHAGSVHVGYYNLQLAVDQTTYETTVQGFYYTGDAGNDEDAAAGKLEPVDTDVWKIINFRYSTPRYPTRDDNGVLLPYSEWIEGEWQFVNSCAIADGLHFSYEPFYEDGAEYYLMFQVTDVQGSSYSSELMPVTPAKDPMAEEDTESTDEISWTDGSLSPVISEEGISARMFASLDPDSGAPVYGFEITNANAFGADVSVSDIILNGEYQVLTEESYTDTEYVPAGGTSVMVIPDIERTLSAAGISSIESISFDLTAACDDDNSCLIHEHKTKLSLNNIEPSLVLCESHGIYAKEQTLCSENGVTVELIGAGFYPESDSSSDNINCLVRVENASSEACLFDMSSAQCDGIALSSSSLPYGSTSIAPDSSRVFLIDYSAGDYDEMMVLARKGSTENFRLNLSLTTEDGEAFEGSGWKDVALTAGEAREAEETAAMTESESQGSEQPDAVNPSDLTFDIYEDENYSLKLMIVRDFKDCGTDYVLRFINNTDSSAYLEFTSFEINGEDQDLASDIYLYAGAGEKKEENVSVINQQIAADEGEIIKSLSGSFKITNYLASGTDAAGDFTFDIPEGEKPQLLCEPCLEAKAEEQVLADNDRVKITLYGLGNYYEDSYFGAEGLKGMLCIQNKTDHDIPAVVTGVTINGQFFRISANAGNTIHAGMSGILNFSVSKYSLTKAGITGIGSVVLTILTDQSESTGYVSNAAYGGSQYTAELSQKCETDENEGFTPDENNLLYDANGIKVYYVDRSLNSSGKPEWQLWVENSSSKGIQINCRNAVIDGESYKNVWIFDEIGAHSSKKCSITTDFLPSEKEYIPELQAELLIKSGGGDRLIDDVQVTFANKE